MVNPWGTTAYALPAFLRHLGLIRRYLSITSQLELMSKEVKRRTKVVEEALEKLLTWRSAAQMSV
ncbi:MAG: hypothetical protein QXI12_05340 [Candidatus Methanomethyliaceae archaeon]